MTQRPSSSRNAGRLTCFPNPMSQSICRSPKPLLWPEVGITDGPWNRRQCCGRTATKAPRVEVKVEVNVRYSVQTALLNVRLEGNNGHDAG